VSCFPELTYAIYVDGELFGDDLRQVEFHLRSCSRCHALVEALRTESRLLSDILVDAENELTAQPIVQPSPRPLDILWTGLAVLAAAGGLQLVWDMVSGFEAPVGANWLNPFSVTAQWNLFFTSLFYFVQEGAAMILSDIITVSLFGLTLLIVAAATVYLRRRPSTVTLLATLTLACLLAAPVSALEHRSGMRAAVGADETLDDTLLAHADSVRIDGTVTGNVIAFTNELTITGTVKGDVVVFCKTFNLDGAVDGNLYAFTQWSNIRGHVGNSVIHFVQQLRIQDSARIDADLLLFVDELNLDGMVGRDVYLFGDRVFVRGSIGRDLKARAGRLTLLAPAKVGGDLFARVKKEKNLHLDPGATVAGKTEVKLPEPRPSRFLRPHFYFQKAVGLGTIFLLGLLVLWLFPVFRSARFAGGPEIFKTIGVGFLALVSPPIAAVLLFLILIGVGVLAGAVLIATLIPLLITVLWLLTLYLSKVLVGLAIGQTLAGRPSELAPRTALPLLVGLVVIYVLISLPIVGHVLNLFVWLIGLGMGVLLAWRRPAATASAVAVSDTR